MLKCVLILMPYFAINFEQANVVYQLLLLRSIVPLGRHDIYTSALMWKNWHFNIFFNVVKTRVEASSPILRTNGFKS